MHQTIYFFAQQHYYCELQSLYGVKPNLRVSISLLMGQMCVHAKMQEEIDVTYW